jgi:arsenate reductase (thioredoxin)
MEASVNSKPTILILCTGNSCRSQIAEGLFREFSGDSYDVCSAGTNPAAIVNPVAVQVMDELGIDISKQYPQKRWAVSRANSC